MSDELECFKKCAELGCPDFIISAGGYVGFKTPTECHSLPMVLCNTAARFNRHAANVCAEWWHQRFLSGKGADPENCVQMIRAARAFASKHGESK